MPESFGDFVRSCVLGNAGDIDEEGTDIRRRRSVGS